MFACETGGRATSGQGILRFIGRCKQLVITSGVGLLRKLAVLAAWADDLGRRVDDRGEIRKADRPALLAALGLPVTVSRSGQR